MLDLFNIVLITDGHRKDEHTLETVQYISENPITTRSSVQCRHYLGHPHHAHHNEEAHKQPDLFFVLLVSVAGPTFIAVKERLSLLQLPGECDGHVDEEEQVDHHKNQDDA